MQLGNTKRQMQFCDTCDRLVDLPHPHGVGTICKECKEFIRSKYLSTIVIHFNKEQPNLIKQYYEVY